MVDEPAPHRQAVSNWTKGALGGGTVSLDRELLVEVASKSFTSAPGSAVVREAAAQASGSEWVVVTDADGNPVGLLRRTDLERADDRQRVGELVKRPIIILPEDQPLAESLETWALHEFAGALTELDGIIAVSHDDRPAGVLGGSLLNRYVLTTRGSSSIDTSMGGTINNIGRIVRSCQFTDQAAARKCTARRSFSRPQAMMPDCKNPDHLTPHAFDW